MRNGKSCAAVLAFCLALSGPRSLSAAQILKTEPAMGKLREGQVVLVDDGSCPAGQIRQVTGGNHVKVGGSKQIVRHSKCIAR